jgi:hypothetical protein
MGIYNVVILSNSSQFPQSLPILTRAIDSVEKNLALQEGGEGGVDPPSGYEEVFLA